VSVSEHFLAKKRLFAISWGKLNSSFPAFRYIVVMKFLGDLNPLALFVAD